MNEFPESLLADLLSGDRVLPYVGQVNGALKTALAREVKAGRLVTWKGYWHPVAGASRGIGPLKTCFGTVSARDAVTAHAA